MKTLPEELKIDLWDILDSDTQERIGECISDFLSKKYKCCAISYGYNVPLYITDIDWDDDE